MEGVDVWLNTRRLWSFVRRYKALFFTLLLLVLTVESTFVFDKYLFKVLIDDSTSFAAGTLAREAYVGTLILLLVIGCIFLVVRGVGKFLFMHLINRLDGGLILDLKLQFFNHLVHLDHGFHATHKTGSLISRMTRGGRAIESMMDSIAFNFAALAFQLVVAFGALFLVGWVSAVTMVLVVLLFLGHSIWIFRRSLPYNKHANDIEDKEKGNISDIFTNIESIKYYGKEDAIKKRFAHLSNDTYGAYMRLWDHYRFADSGQSVILTIGGFAILTPLVLGFLEGTSTIGDITFAFTIFMSLIGPMFGVIFGMRNYYKAMTDFESLYEYEAFENAIKDAPHAPRLLIREGRISFEDVSFAYQGTPFVDRFSLEIRPGTKVAFVGRSGAGKSTIVKLLYRLYDLQGGRIRIDGTDIRDVQQESLRSELSIVPQEGVLFDDTIWNNIAFSRPEATPAQIWDAIRFAKLDALIERLPKKEHTVVGERGVRLSGGERQRVSIARALLADRKVLVLDEATSALDSETEHEIQRELKALMKGRTTIIIAHRLSTIMSADVIVVLDEGKVVQKGTHATLIRKDGLYKRLWELQKGGYIG